MWDQAILENQSEFWTRRHKTNHSLNHCLEADGLAKLEAVKLAEIYKTKSYLLLHGYHFSPPKKLLGHYYFLCWENAVKSYVGIPIFILYLWMLSSPYKQLFQCPEIVEAVFKFVSGKRLKRGEIFNWGHEMGWHILSLAVSGPAGHFPWLELLGIAVIQIGCQCILHQSCLCNATSVFNLCAHSQLCINVNLSTLKIFSHFYKLLIIPVI